MAVLSFSQSLSLLNGVPVVPLTLVGPLHVSLGGIVDTGATLCQIPGTYVSQAGLTTSGAANASVATASGTVSLPVIQADLYVFGRRWANQWVVVGSGGPVLLGRDFLFQALAVLGIDTSAQDFHWS